MTRGAAESTKGKSRDKNRRRSLSVLVRLLLIWALTRGVLGRLTLVVDLGLLRVDVSAWTTFSTFLSRYFASLVLTTYS